LASFNIFASSNDFDVLRRLWLIRQNYIPGMNPFLRQQIRRRAERTWWSCRSTCCTNRGWPWAQQLLSRNKKCLHLFQEDELTFSLEFSNPILSYCYNLNFLFYRIVFFLNNPTTHYVCPSHPLSFLWFTDYKKFITWSKTFVIVSDFSLNQRKTTNMIT
jgi:hypothetical protein